MSVPAISRVEAFAILNAMLASGDYMLAPNQGDPTGARTVVAGVYTVHLLRREGDQWIPLDFGINVYAS
jgi:hypothetical protein